MKSRFVFIFLFVLLLLITHIAGSQQGSGEDERGGLFAAEVQDFFDALNLGKAVVCDGFTLFPIGYSDTAGFARLQDGIPEFLSAEEAYKTGTIYIDELENASVSDVMLRNDNTQPLFFMAGQLLKGAKQDRIIAHDFILPPTVKELILPVYCVEQGRWTGDSPAFAFAKSFVPQSVRGSAASKMSQVQVWNQVGLVNESIGFAQAESIGESLDVIESNEQYERVLSCITRQTEKWEINDSFVGVVALLHGELHGMDLFGSHQLLKDHLANLIEGYVSGAFFSDADTIENATAGESAGVTEAAPTDRAATRPAARQTGTEGLGAEALGELSFVELNSPGEGEEFLISSDSISGSVLFHNMNIIHLALFESSAAPEISAGTRERMNVSEPQVQEQSPQESERYTEQFQQDDLRQEQVQVQGFVQQIVQQADDVQRTQSFKENGITFTVDFSSR